MRAMLRWAGGVWRGRRGVTALEYGLIAAIIGAIIISFLTSYGAAIAQAYNDLGHALVVLANGM